MQALALFENELLLSAACRKNVVERKQGGYAPLGKQQRSARTSRGKATVTTPEELAALLVRPASFSLPVQSADRALLRAARDGPSASVQGTPQALRAPIKMVMRQLQRLAKDQLPYLKVTCRAFPCLALPCLALSCLVLSCLEYSSSHMTR
jgi:hypothetical protein